MARALIFDRERCLACRSCELACAVIHSQTRQLGTAIAEEPRPTRRVSIVRAGGANEALRCEQCDEPLCVFSCKSGALHRRPDDGRVAFDKQRCVGCLMCLMVCPSGIRHDPARDRVVRCDTCAKLETPPCVASCPTRALQAGEKTPERPVTDFAGHVVIVGSSAAGIAACEAARERAPHCTITVVTADEGPDYSRPLLTYALAGRIGADQLGWRPEKYLAHDLGATVLRGVNASALDGRKRVLVLDNGQEVAYDRLIIATGASSAPVDIPGADLPGVFGLRNLADLEDLHQLATPDRRAVVLGGGNVGLQVCEALVERGLQVTLAIKSPHPLSQMVDAEAGRRVADLFERHGVTVRAGRDGVAVTGAGRVEAVLLDDGEIVPADIVIVGKGIVPNLAWLLGSGVETRRGIVVDPCGRASVAGVFAAGDCAEATDPVSGRSQVSGIWPVAYETGRAAGSTAVGIEQPTRGALRMNASRFFGETIISVGEAVPERLAGATGHVLVDTDVSYRKLVYRDGRLVGALLYGDVSGAGTYYRLYRESVDLSGVPPGQLADVQLELAIGIVRKPVPANTGPYVPSSGV